MEQNPSDEQRKYPGMPRWVKITLIALIVAVLVVVLVLASGGQHGPARHLPALDPAGRWILAGRVERF